MVSGHITMGPQTLSMQAQTGKNKSPKQRKIQDDVWALVGGDDYLDENSIVLRKRMRAFMESIQPSLIKHINDCTFPHELKEEIAKLGINGFHLTDFGGPGLSLHAIGACGFEAGRIDASIGTFIAVHNCLGICTIDLLGSDE